MLRLCVTVLYCVSCWLTANLAGAQPSKLTNLFPDDLLLTPHVLLCDWQLIRHQHL